MKYTWKMAILTLALAGTFALPIRPASAATATSPAPTFQNGVLADQHGMTLYVFSKDTAGTSNCYDKCAILWPPLLAPSDASPSGHFSLITRNDGTKQWAYDSQPVYLFQKDGAPGDKSGNGYLGLWKIVPTP